MKKLAVINHRKDVHDKLSELDVTQTEYKELQNATLEDFLKWRDKTLGITASLHPNTHLDIRKAWLWVFSVQVAYGLRIHEVFAIANAFEPYVTKDGVSIPALNDPNNKDNILVLKGETLIGTTTKTGYRLARPQIPPKYPDLLEKLEIKIPTIPVNKPRSKDPNTIRKFYCNKATEQLGRWNAPTTETHAFRHLDIDEEYQLSPEEYKLFDDYLKKNDYWVGEGFFEVFKLGLEAMEGRKEIIIHLDRDERISRAEAKIEAISACIRSLSTKNEKLEEQITDLQDEIK